MRPDHFALWNRIEAFDIDGDLPPQQRFVNRPAKENSWKPTFADEAVRERHHHGAFDRPTKRTRKADAVLANLSQRNERLRTLRSDAASADASLAVALVVEEAAVTDAAVAVVAAAVAVAAETERGPSWRKRRQTWRLWKPEPWRNSRRVRMRRRCGPGTANTWATRGS